MAGNVKRIVCLANSVKYGGTCVAGKELLSDGKPGSWIRPVSDLGSGALVLNERKCADGSDPAVLDVLTVPLATPNPEDYQQENWLIDRSKVWSKTGRLAPSALGPFVDPIEPLWIDGHSSKYGQNNRIPIEQFADLADSLRLIYVESLTLVVSFQGSTSLKLQGQFPYAGKQYGLQVTDPQFRARFLKDKEEMFPIGPAFLTISLGMPFFDDYSGKTHTYKLIAAIITP